MRAFVAVEIPDALKAGIATVQDRLKGAGVDAAWSRPEGMHLTLKFLGEVSAAGVPGILKALTAAASGTEHFRLGVEGVGAFPNPASARVVWLGLTGDLEALSALQVTVEQAMAGLGIAREERPYTPHLTLGRIKLIRKRAAWLGGLAGVRDSRLSGFEVAAINLIESQRRPSGAVYRELGRVDLQ